LWADTDISKEHAASIFSPEDGGIVFLWNFGILPQTSQRDNPEDHNLNNHHCENVKIYTKVEHDAVDCENINWIELANDWIHQ
jgi:hypothetical protein